MSTGAEQGTMQQRTIDVTASCGTVRGLRRDGDAAFLGIPFAAPPVGERRFAAPERLAPFAAAHDATRHGATAQRRPFGPHPGIPEPSIPGESTLNVDVFTPAPGDRAARLPVMVWIHGGGWFAGSPASPWYDGASFTRDGVVTVTLSYRLGFDGWGWIDGAPLNRGQLDQLAALEWVQENIADFGGDPGRVTIAGQSAGGGSVLALLSSPRAAGLVHGAIAHSPAPITMTAADAEELGRAYAADLGIAPTIEGWRQVDEERILDTERERNTSPGSLPPDASFARMLSALRAQAVRWGTGGGPAFSPAVDGDVVGTSVTAGPRVPLIVGITRDEFTGDGADEREELRAALDAAGVGAAAQRGWMERIDAVGAQRTRSQVVSLCAFGPGLTGTSRAREAAGLAERTWQYAFDHPSAATGVAQHCVELPYAFDLLDAEGVAEQLGPRPPQHLADDMHRRWVEFIAGGAADWPSIGAPGSGGAAGALVLAEHVAHDPARLAVQAELIG